VRFATVTAGVTRAEVQPTVVVVVSEIHKEPGSRSLEQKAQRTPPASTCFAHSRQGLVANAIVAHAQGVLASSCVFVQDTPLQVAASISNDRRAIL
jgi:hypothetical protein